MTHAQTVCIYQALFSGLGTSWLYSSDYVLRTHDSVISNAEEAIVEGDAVCF